MKTLPDCPDRPSCVCSQDARPRHAIEPFVLAAPERWNELVDRIAKLPRAQRMSVDANGAEFEFRTALLRFVDDVSLARDGELVHVRSCSRVGHWDLGTNRRRIESLRALLLEQGLLSS